MRVLFIVPYSSEGASNRYRVEQYLPYLEKEGIYYDIRPFVFEKFYKILYVKGDYLKKIIYFVRAVLNRMVDIIRLYRYDAVFIHREACPLGPPVFEWLIYKSNKPIIFDFDDAIFLQNFNPVNWIFSFFKFPSKTKAIIKMASMVIAANTFLEKYAKKHNQRVYVIPTPIDTDKFFVSQKNLGELTIGWLGSPTSSPYLKIIFNAIKSVSLTHDFIFKIIGSAEKNYIPGVKVEFHDWCLEKEVQDFQSMDIGIYPLPDILWTYGKAAFKAIQYMSVGVPVVASPVGMTKELIQDGVNGFLAYSEEEWIKKISRLIEDKELRKKIGLNGRKTVEEKFSLKVNAPIFIKAFKNSEVRGVNGSTST